MEEGNKIKLVIPVVPLTVNFKLPMPSRLKETKDGDTFRGMVDYTSMMVGWTQVPIEVGLELEVGEEWLTQEQSDDLKKKLVALGQPFNEAALDLLMQTWDAICVMQDEKVRRGEGIRNSGGR